MRIYMVAESGVDKKVKEMRVKSSIEDLKNNPRRQSILSLEPPPIISTDLDKGKGIVFEYVKENPKILVEDSLMKDAINSGIANSRLTIKEDGQSETEPGGRRVNDSSSNNSPTGYRIGFSKASSSETVKKKKKPRKRPHMSNRKPIKKDDNPLAITDGKMKGLIVGIQTKRKAQVEAGDKENEGHNHKQMRVTMEDGDAEPAISSSQEVVPNEGPSTI